MDIGDLLNKTFKKENEHISEIKSLPLNGSNLNIDAFLQKYNHYVNDNKTLLNRFKNDVKGATKLYESRLDKEELYAQKEKIYNQAKKDEIEEKYYQAYQGFSSILTHRDSEEQAKNCLKVLNDKYDRAVELHKEQKYEEAIKVLTEIVPFKDSKDLIKKCNEDKDTFDEKDKIYNKALYDYRDKHFYNAWLTFLDIPNHRDVEEYIKLCVAELDKIYNHATSNYNLKRFEDARDEFASIPRYKDSSDMAQKCREIISDQILTANRIAEEKAKRKKRATIITISSLTSAIIAAALVLTFVVIIPDVKLKERKSNYETGLALINSGEYQKASGYLNGIDYEDSANLYYVALAGSFFQNGDYNQGVENMCLSKGTTLVTYDSNGGTASKDSETITEYKAISATANKDYYDFNGWNIANFAIQISGTNYTCSLSLKADFSLTEYKITYVLGGGKNSSSNPDSYTYETSTINLANPTRTGYTFIGWTVNDEPISSINNHSSGDLVITANWNVNQYTLNLDYGEGEHSGEETYKLDYGASLDIEDPHRKGAEFLGWYDENDNKISSSWTMPDKEVTLKAKYRYYSLDYLVYDDIYDHNSYYMPGDGWFISEIRSGYKYSELVIPSEIDGKKVIAIDNDAYKSSTDITYLEIEPGLDYIEPGFLGKFTNLKELVTPFIGVAAEWNWRYVTGFYYQLGIMFSITSGDTNTDQYYYYRHGYSDSKPKSQNLTETNTTSYEIFSCYIPTSLKTVRVTQSKNIYYGAFSNCTNITNIILKPGTSSYGHSFTNCPATITYRN